jgi:hypothetical protein
LGAGGKVRLGPCVQRATGGQHLKPRRADALIDAQKRLKLHLFGDMSGNERTQGGVAQFHVVCGSEAGGVLGGVIELDDVLVGQ